MNTLFKRTALAGLLFVTGHALAVEDITRADQIPVLKAVSYTHLRAHET